MADVVDIMFSRKACKQISYALKRSFYLPDIGNNEGFGKWAVIPTKGGIPLALVRFLVPRNDKSE